jgi:hypothetical protein
MLWCGMSLRWAIYVGLLDLHNQHRSRILVKIREKPESRTISWFFEKGSENEF